jgi:hypothetical protein
MTITRTITIDDLTPQELADRFANMFDNEQAEFFAEVAKIAATWPGAGMCQQAYSIASHLDDEGRSVIQRLAEHAGLIPEDAA